MIRIAILGDIGAGKSFVSKQFNCPLFNADKEVAEIYKNDRSCYQKIKKALPKYIISDHLDKKFLLKAVFIYFHIRLLPPVPRRITGS